MQAQRAIRKLAGYVPKVSFTVVLIAFFLPFVLIKCDDKEIARVKGTELITGTSINYEDPFSEKNQQRKVAPNVYAIVLFAIAFIALIVSFLPITIKHFILFFASFLGLIDFVLLYNSIQEELALEFGIEFLTGFYIIPVALLFNFIFFIVAFASQAISPKNS